MRWKQQKVSFSHCICWVSTKCKIRHSKVVNNTLKSTENCCNSKFSFFAPLYEDINIIWTCFIFQTFFKHIRLLSVCCYQEKLKKNFKHILMKDWLIFLSEVSFQCKKFSIYLILVFENFKKWEEEILNKSEIYSKIYTCIIVHKNF